jgi:3-deoxy-manno-octulosonate cytidylyltransferase (CMP-KDO synthetase)
MHRESREHDPTSENEQRESLSARPVLHEVSVATPPERCLTAIRRSRKVPLQDGKEPRPCPDPGALFHHPFPRKPLALLAGKPMVVHVVERAREAGCFDEVVVATDDERIAQAAKLAGARAVLTGPCRSGTDRVAEAVRELPADVVLNVQGDEPALPPENLKLLAGFLRTHPEVPMATLALSGAPNDLDNPNVVKVVCDLTGRALYFSRAPIPYPRNPGVDIVLRHVGLYGFQREALLAFASWPETELERAEGLEQLRALAHGLQYMCCPRLPIPSPWTRPRTSHPRRPPSPPSRHIRRGGCHDSSDTARRSAHCTLCRVSC